MLLVLLSTGHQVEHAGQDEHSRALGQASNDTEDESQIVNENCGEGHDHEIREADQKVKPAGQLIFRFDLTLH